MSELKVRVKDYNVISRFNNSRFFSKIKKYICVVLLTIFSFSKKKLYHVIFSYKDIKKTKISFFLTRVFFHKKTFEL